MLAIQLIVALASVIWAIFIFRLAKSQGVKAKDPTNTKLYMIPIMALALFFTVFRSESTGVDHVTYASINNILAESSWSGIWSISYINMEPVLLFMMKALSSLGAGLMPFLFITTLTVFYVYYRQIKEHSAMAWMSVFLLFTFTGYFTIFNTTAQMVVSVLAFGASIFIYKGQFWKFFISILLLSLVHKTALFMIPMYFLLRIRPSGSNRAKIVYAVIGTVAVVSHIFLDKFISIGTTVLFPEYKGAVDTLPVVSPLVAVKPILVLALAFFYRGLFDFNNMKERVWFNAIIYTSILTLLSIKFGLFQRFTYFLLPYAVLLVPLIITRSRNKALLVVLVVLGLIFYMVLTNAVSGGDYAFIWQ